MIELSSCVRSPPILPIEIILGLFHYGDAETSREKYQ